MPRQPDVSDPWAFLRHATEARLALGRTGDGLPTARLLEFTLDHARARDAVHATLDVDALAADLPEAPVVVESRADSRSLYLQRPDLGRQLSDAARARLAAGAYDGVVVLADGLSAMAVQTQGAALYRLIRATFPGRLAPPVIGRQARVALGDAIAAALGAELVILLIGERPGLSAANSLGAYLTFAPKPGCTRDAGRNCVSNIRPGGLELAEAARRILAIARLARNLKKTGTELKEDAARALAGQKSAEAASFPGPKSD